MAETIPQPDTPPKEDALDQGAYDVIRGRLDAHADDLRARLATLNTARKDVFGAIPFELQSTDRITTAHNCIPRDIVAFGGHFVMGFNVHFGLKSTMDVGDVFAIYRFEDGAFHEEGLDLLADPAFQKDFTDLFRFYKNATFAKFFRKDQFVYMKFHIGSGSVRDPDDFKAFKWAIESDRLAYLGNRSDHEVRYPPQHDFNWTRATRDMQSQGAFPHYNIEDLCFVETTGGDLTIKVEDSTDTGQGLYAEPVDDPDQGLDDAEVYYVVEGPLVLLRIRPYQEQAWRHFVFNSKLQEVVRADGMADAAMLLPEDHGLMLADGVYLATGKRQFFSTVPSGLVFDRRIASPNGEDFAYVFYQRHSGLYVILAYNLIAQEVQTPILAHGYALPGGATGDGRLVFFKTGDDPTPQKHHAVQIWQTPFVGPDRTPDTASDSRLFQIGNRDVVRGMAECAQVLDLVGRRDLYSDLYVDLVRTTSDLLDTYFWLGEDDAANVAEPLAAIRDAAQAAVGEYEKVTRQKRDTQRQVDGLAQETTDTVRKNAARVYRSIADFVDALGLLRGLRGRVIGLRELRYVDEAVVNGLETQLADQTEVVSQKTVAFLLEPGSLDPYRAAAAAHDAAVPGLVKAADAEERSELLGQTGTELEMLIDVVGNLKIDDATERTQVVDDISAIFALLNATRSRLRSKQQELGKSEGVAEFGSQLKLLNQSVANYLDLSDTPEKTDAYLTKLMVQLEELEGRFAEFDDFVLELTEKREEVYTAFENRKLALVEKRNQRADKLGQAATRILKGIRSRAEAMDDVAEINAYFAGDLMIDKVRDLVAQLEELDDAVRVGDIRSRLKSTKEDAVRQLKDRIDLQGGGKDTIRFGRHGFAINVQPVDLTAVVRDDTQTLHLTGTQFFEPLHDERLNAARDVWDQTLVSETDDVYRAEYLAYKMLTDGVAARDTNISREGEPSGEPASQVPRGSAEASPSQKNSPSLLTAVQKYMAPRYAEGYVKGVHDHDAALYLGALVELRGSLQLLRFPGPARVLARLWWTAGTDEPTRNAWSARLSGFGAVARVFPQQDEQAAYIAELTAAIRAFASAHDFLDPELADDAGTYLFHELRNPADGFVVSPAADALYTAFHAYLEEQAATLTFRDGVHPVDDSLARHRILTDWAAAFVAARGNANEAESTDELAALLAHDKHTDFAARVHPVAPRRQITGLLGDHPRIENGEAGLNYPAFVARLRRFTQQRVPRFEAFQHTKHAVLDDARHAMRLEEFTPKVLTSFVRNRLLDEVFLPLIGDNLAKQIGTAGADTRTDRMGLLLLISPPGYGKTTLMEYVCNRLGMIFMKINGPAIGHHVTSIDPAEATNAAAREELEKLNLAFEMGDNVMIYVDDIQHTNPEFLQKFISLCDAQRRIEGVYKGRSKTYHLRGRRVAVVMAGNPYTESGEAFRIPDMLSNRADTYNLGDIIGSHADAFKMSYLENALTSNPALNPLATASRDDIHTVIRMAETDSREGIELEGNFPTDALDELVDVIQKLIVVRDVILNVNLQYIASAGQDDAYRTEPPFLLQGSYRNMNRIAEKVSSVMNDDELRGLIESTYEQDAQTLTTGAEANLLKFRELMGWMTDDEAKRWDDIKAAFVRHNAVSALGGDTTAAAIAQLTGVNQQLAKLVASSEKLAAPNVPSGTDVPSVVPPQEGMLTIADTLTTATDRLIAHLADARAREASVPEQSPPATGPLETTPREIRVINKIPDTFLYVMKEQFGIMQAWMEPFAKVNARQDQQLNELGESLKEIIGRYGKVIERLEGSRE